MQLPFSDPSSSIRLQPEPAPTGNELAMNLGRGIPGWIAFSSSVAFPLHGKINDPSQIEPFMKYTAHIGSKSQTEMEAVGTSLSRLGQVVILQSNSVSKNDYHVWVSINPDEARKIIAAKQDSNNIVEFGRKLRDAGGAVAEAVGNAARFGAVVVTAVLTVLWNSVTNSWSSQGGGENKPVA
jgi:hypothetical protein